MKSVRLLPVVIFAIAALLVFKTIGLVTNGGYVLGTATVQAAEGGDHGAAPAAGGDAANMVIDEPTMADTAPTLDDGAPTLGDTKPGEHGAAAPAAGDAQAAAPAEGGLGATETPAATAEGAAAATPATTDAAATDHGSAAPDAHTGKADETVCPPLPTLTETDLAVPADAKQLPEGSGAAAHEAAATPAAPAADAAAMAEAPAADKEAFAKGLEANCDPKSEGVPMTVDSSGKLVPIAGEDGGSLTEKALLERLTKRRTDLDTYATQLDMRQSLIDAAEKKIDERAATLKQLQDQIGTLVDQKKEAESGQFAAIVTMYENMKPKEAATIFNDLNMDVLLRVAQAMNPRKMAPILAAMTSARAQELTVAMANIAATPAETMTPQDLAALPQIVGQ